MVGGGERVLVVLPTWVGDVVMATPVLRALRRGMAGASIAWMGSRTALDTLSGLDWADERVVDTSKRGGLRGLVAAAKRLREGEYGTAVLLSNAFRVALLCRMGGCGRIVGYARDGRGWLLSESLQPKKRPGGGYEPVPAVEYYAALAERVGCEVADKRMSLAVEGKDAAAAEELFHSAGIEAGRAVVTVNPGASFGASKLYPAERLAWVADELIERHGAQVIINAAPNEKAIAAAVGGAMRNRPAVNFAERDNSLGLLKAIISQSSLVITGDTGPRHIAAALGTAVVTIFGPTDPAWTVIDYSRERIVSAGVDCAPCQQKVCPLPAGAGHHRCMTELESGVVLEAAESLLSSEGLL